MKKALIVKEPFMGREVGHIEQIGEAQDIDSWTHYLKEKMVVVEVPQELEHLKAYYLESYTVPATEDKDSYISLRKKPEADQMLRENKINKLRAKRSVLLSELDIKINIAEDNNEDSSALRQKRKELRDITEQFKKVDGSWKVAVDSLDVENFEM